MRKFFSDLRKLFGQLPECALNPLFRHLHGILLLSLAAAQKSANERSEDKRKQDEGEWIFSRVTMTTAARFRRTIKIGKVRGRFWIRSKVRRRV